MREKIIPQFISRDQFLNNRQTSLGGGRANRGKIQLVHKFEDIVSVENLLSAWQEFVRGKRSKPDVQQFSINLIDNILQLHEDLVNKNYRHGGYHQFKISDPKPRDINKASVRDRLVHHAIYRILYPFFDKTFIAGSYSCRNNKGTHKALEKFQRMFYQMSRNNTRTVWVLKLDIKKFFASINHEVLKDILAKHIPDKDILWLLDNIINSFPPVDKSNDRYFYQHIGLPLGNLTSQLLVNVYMNEFDQFMKHQLKAKYYIRYADDFVILSHNKQELINQLSIIQTYLETKLKLTLHPNKIFLNTFASGIDFLGWVNFPTHRVLRTATKKRMMKRIKNNPRDATLQSYLGLLKHGDAHKLSQEVLLVNGDVF